MMLIWLHIPWTVGVSQLQIVVHPYSYAYDPRTMYFQKGELNVRLTTFLSVSKDCEGQMQPQKLLSRTMTNLFILNLSALHAKEGGKPAIATAMRIARFAILPAS